MLLFSVLFFPDCSLQLLFGMQNLPVQRLFLQLQLTLKSMEISQSLLGIPGEDKVMVCSIHLRLQLSRTAVNFIFFMRCRAYQFVELAPLGVQHCLTLSNVCDMSRFFVDHGWKVGLVIFKGLHGLNASVDVGLDCRVPLLKLLHFCPFLEEVFLHSLDVARENCALESPVGLA